MAIADAKFIVGEASGDLSNEILTKNIPLVNLIRNGSFESWSQGTDTNPDGWDVFYQAPCEVLRDSTEKKMGVYSVKLISETTYWATLGQTIPREDNFTVTYTFGCWVKTNSANKVHLEIYDGIGSVSSNNHSGGGNWEWLTVKKVVTTSAQEIQFFLYVESGTVSGWFDGAVVVKNLESTETELIFAFAPHLLDVGGEVYKDLSLVKGVGITDKDKDTKIQLEESLDEDKIRFDTFGAERMIIDNNGKVGIGTSAPDELLHVSGGNIKLDGSHKVTGLAAPTTNGDAIRQTTKITEANLEDAVDNTHGVLTVDQSQTSYDAVDVLRYNTYNQSIAQTFTPAVSKEITAVKLRLRRDGTPAGNVWVEIWDTSSGTPSAIKTFGVDGREAKSGKIDVNRIATGTADEFVFILPKGIKLTANTVYAIVLQGDYTISTSNEITILIKASTNPYSGGCRWDYDGSGWDSTVNDDWLFYTYYGETNALPLDQLLVGAGTLPVADGGTGASSKTAAFDALSPLTTQGDILYHDGTNNVRLAKGTAGQVLKMNSGATAPEWATTGSIGLLAYPVGAIYMSVVSTSPATLFGGTWSAFGTGRVLVGIDTGQTEFNTVEKTGGAKTHQLSIAELAAHTHGQSHSATQDGSTVSACIGENGTANSNTTSTGSGTAHNNLQPYIVVYMWKRTA